MAGDEHGELPQAGRDPDRERRDAIVGVLPGPAAAAVPVHFVVIAHGVDRFGVGYCPVGPDKKSGTRLVGPAIFGIPFRNRSHFANEVQLHPLVSPHESHLQQAPLLTSVNWPQEEQGSPS
jgi:hypothetical protein